MLDLLLASLTHAWVRKSAEERRRRRERAADEAAPAPVVVAAAAAAAALRTRADRAQGMLALRRLWTPCAAPLPLRDTAKPAAHLSAWIYGGTAESELPAGAEVHHVQEQSARDGRHMRWAVVLFGGAVYVVFRGSTEAVYDWVENGAFQLRRVRTGSGGSILTHSGFWSAVESVAEDIGVAISAALSRTSPHAPIVACGHSKGGANAAAFTCQLLLGLIPHTDVVPGQVSAVTFGAPRVVSALSPGFEHLQGLFETHAPSSAAFEFAEDPVAALLGPRGAASVSHFLGLYSVRGGVGGWMVERLGYGAAIRAVEKPLLAVAGDYAQLLPAPPAPASTHLSLDAHSIDVYCLQADKMAASGCGFDELQWGHPTRKLYSAALTLAREEELRRDSATRHEQAARQLLVRLRVREHARQKKQSSKL
eukprot:TRINITY_DN1315_c1_g1_i1.p1 TRINITY_DN1315_c1_g1~~TRINITY_DN1315_c1_g1_i1.p1  ORF type:complete len:434 (+),score=102.15 TRINITY_DN1315_c1_g1_i1:35-1303(+)